MSRYILLLLFPLFGSPLFAQSKTEVAACLRACLLAPELEAAFTQEWGDLRPLYLRKREVASIGNQSIDEQLNQLTGADFQGLPWEVIPATPEEILQLPAEEAQFGVLEASIGFREEKAVVNFYVNLPNNARKWLTASFLLQKEDGQWAITQKSVEVRP